MYELIKVSIVIKGRDALLNLKVSNRVITKPDGTTVQGICFVKSDGTDGAIQFWTPEQISNSKNAALLLAKEEDKLRDEFAGVAPESDSGDETQD
tara:strand:+ start:1013 stop:1297 length:285 start_codon:yes stop_codon:yes gene_type:complete